MTTAISARVLITAPRPSTAGALAVQLARCGVTAASAAGDEAAIAEARRGAADAIVLDAAGRPRAEAAALARQLREAAAPRRPVVLALLDQPAADAREDAPFDAVLLAPSFDTQIAARLKTLVRLAVMEDEAQVRATSVAAHGGRLRRTRAPRPDAAWEALYMGAPSRDYLAINRAVTAADGVLSASLSTFAGFDFLHERDFDAVILNALDDDDGALTICSALRRNTRLFHLPALMLVRAGAYDRAEEAFERGASDLLAAGAGHDEIIARITALTRERRRRERLRAAFAALRAPEVTDAETGLVSAAFFMDHLQRMAERARCLDRPLSLLVLRAEAPPEADRGARAAAYRQLGGMIRRLVRVEDCAARLETNVYAVALPGCALAAARKTAERLEAVGECTAFEGRDDMDDPFQMTLHAAAAELRAQETGRGLLLRTLAAFRPKADVKAV